MKKWLYSFLGLDALIKKEAEYICTKYVESWGFENKVLGLMDTTSIRQHIKVLNEKQLAEVRAQLMREIESEKLLDGIVKRIKDKQLS